MIGELDDSNICSNLIRFILTHPRPEPLANEEALSANELSNPFIIIREVF